MNKKTLYPLLVLALGLAAAFFIAVNEPVVVPEPYEPMAPTVRVPAYRPLRNIWVSVPRVPCNRAARVN